jgi:hypothetical protein
MRWSDDLFVPPPATFSVPGIFLPASTAVRTLPSRRFATPSFDRARSSGHLSAFLGKAKATIEFRFMADLKRSELHRQLQSAPSDILAHLYRISTAHNSSGRKRLFLDAFPAYPGIIE